MYSSVFLFVYYIAPLLDCKCGGLGLVTKSCLTLVTPWTVAFQTPLSMGFSRQEYWSGLPFPFPGDLPDPGIESGSPALKLKVKSLNRVQLFVTPWTVTYQAPPSMGFSRQEYWSGVPLPSPGDLPRPRD